jgi:predicted acyl esterase
MELTGHPIIQATLAANATDASLFVYLTELTPDGKAHYITEGMFRYLHRKEPSDIREAVEALDGCTEQHGGLEYEKLVPFHTFNRSDSQPLEVNTPASARFDCLPVSYMLRKGSRLKISFAGLDADHFATIPGAPTELTLHHSAAYPTFVQVPLKPVKAENQ